MTTLQHQNEHLLAFCKASADTIRLDILRVLRADSYGVMELCQIFDLPQPGLSHHLKILNKADLVETRREGNSIFYRRAMIQTDHPLSAMKQCLFETIDSEVRLSSEISRRILEVNEERSRNSRQFFDKNAERFKENQDLIARYEQYAGSVADLIQNEVGNDHSCAIEIGPGDTQLLSLLNQNFSEVIGLDSSPEMLQLARSSVVDQQSGLRFELADITSQETACRFKDRAQLVVMNMVLHHIASPAAVFQSVHQMLTSGGSLLIIDLCSHDQDWAREICGDLWLGFDAGDLHNWASEADLYQSQSVFLGLKNGFQIQMHMYHSKPLNEENS